MDHRERGWQPACIKKAATDKFPLTRRKKRPCSSKGPGMESVARYTLSPSPNLRSISLGGRGSSRSRGPRRRDIAPNTREKRDGELIISWPLVDSHASTIAGQCAGDCLLLFIFTRRGINLRLSRIQPCAESSARANTHTRIQTHVRIHTRAAACERSARMVRHG